MTVSALDSIAPTAPAPAEPGRACPDTVGDRPGTPDSQGPSPGPTDVVVEWVYDDAGRPVMTHAIGGTSDPLWRVRSVQHGTQLVVGERQALMVASGLLEKWPGALSIRRSPADGERPDPPPDPKAPTAPPEQVRTPQPTRSTDDQARRTQADRGERRSR